MFPQKDEIEILPFKASLVYWLAQKNMNKRNQTSNVMIHNSTSGNTISKTESVSEMRQIATDPHFWEVRSKRESKMVTEIFPCD